MIPKDTKKDLRDALRTLSMAYGNCIRHISKESGVTSRNYTLEDGKQCFGFIPHYGYDDTIHILTKLRGNYRYCYVDRPKFLDIGCGIGNIVLLAQAVGYAADGLEYVPDTCEVAEQMCGGAKIFKADMNKFEHYGNYDVLYYYQPMVGIDDMERFARKLAKEVKPGAYVISHGFNETFQESTEFYHVHGHYVWKKKEK